MRFKLQADGIHIVCHSPVWMQRMIDWGVSLIEPSRAEGLSKVLEMEAARKQPVLGHFGDARRPIAGMPRDRIRC